MPKPTVVKGAGDIRAVVEEYRALLGDDNGGTPETHTTGRREINWDAVPDDVSQPNGYPEEFFNAPEEPRLRGAVLSTPGDHLGVSADADNPSGALPRFGDINPTYVDTFSTFSAEKLFSPVGSNVANIQFFVPGTDTPAAVRGFGAVYTDVDSKGAADFTYYDAKGKVLGKFAVPKSKDGLSFLGVAYPKAIVGRVKIVYGSIALGPEDGPGYDVAVHGRLHAGPRNRRACVAYVDGEVRIHSSVIWSPWTSLKSRRSSSHQRCAARCSATTPSRSGGGCSSRSAIPSGVGSNAWKTRCGSMRTSAGIRSARSLARKQLCAAHEPSSASAISDRHASTNAEPGRASMTAFESAGLGAPPSGSATSASRPITNGPSQHSSGIGATNSVSRSA